MKKLLGFAVILIGLIFACMLSGVHIPKACASDAKDFAAHIQDQGHIDQFGGLDKALGFLRGIADGSINFNVYGNDARYIITVTGSQFGSGVVIAGNAVMPTAFPATTARINDLIRGMTMRTGGADIDNAKNTASCFADALQTATVSAPSSLPISATSIIVGLLALVSGGIMVLGGSGSRSMGGSPA